MRRVYNFEPKVVSTPDSKKWGGMEEALMAGEADLIFNNIFMVYHRYLRYDMLYPIRKDDYCFVVSFPPSWTYVSQTIIMFNIG